MCGRFTLTWSDYDKLAKELEVAPDPAQAAEHKARFNIAPTQMHWILKTGSDGRRLARAKWGLVNAWAKDQSRGARQINARGEKVDSSPAFRAAFARRRCLVPADGFYEWTGTKGNKQPVWFHPQDGGLILMAGLYEYWNAPDSDQRLTSFTIITTDPNAVTGQYHQRMPAIIAPEDWSRWLMPHAGAEAPDKGTLKELLRPAPDDLLGVRPVSKLVNSVGNDRPELLELAPGPPQGSLLG